MWYSVRAALPGEGGDAGAGGGQRAPAAGGDPHVSSGGSAQRPLPPGFGELPDWSAAGPTQGTTNVLLLWVQKIQTSLTSHIF